ncbi:MAG: GDP-mannose 4,6-dehydratase [Magnetococcales bacterium]|nr:GDP-mannose 4,6-dehydratase [Magnetococcales bacterium]
MGKRAESVVVTGGAGFIGSELTRQLLASGAHVTVVDNLVNGKRENLANIESDLLRLEVVDIRDTDTMRSLLRGADKVFHLACMGVRHSIHNPAENHDVNASATLGLLQLAKSANVKRFIYVSSSEVYGTTRFAPMTEEHTTFPMTVYGASKLAGECYARAFFETYDFPTVVVRPFNSFGPRCHHEGDSGEVIPKFMLRALAGKPLIVFGDGSQTRDFTFVTDTARGIVLAGETDKAVGQTINLGSGIETSIKDLADEVKRTVNRQDAEVQFHAPRPGDILRLIADSSKASDLLNYAPAMELRDGLVLLRDWYQQQESSVEELLKEEVVHNWTHSVPE